MKELTEAWARMVRRVEPTVVIDVTTHSPSTADVLFKRFKRCCAGLNDSESTFFNRYLLCWVFLERNSGDARFAHLHSLASRFDPDYSQAFKRRLDRELGRSRVEPFDPARGFTYYVGEKPSTNKLFDYGLRRINSRYRGRGRSV